MFLNFIVRFLSKIFLTSLVAIDSLRRQFKIAENTKIKNYIIYFEGFSRNNDLLRFSSTFP